MALDATSERFRRGDSAGRHEHGLQAIDISDPGVPLQGGWFSPTPLAAVATEDPALSAGPNKVVVWSYPIVKNGLIYVIDIPDDLPGVTECSASGPRGCADLALIHALGVGGMEMV